MNAILKVKSGLRIVLAATALANVIAVPVNAQEAAILQISVQNHRFEPAEIHGPANKPIVLKVKNLDATPMEFESATLRVEKVVTANSEGTINVRPLRPGRYNFFDDFHQETTGVLVLE
jgi:cupredoxin-like protein